MDIERDILKNIVESHLNEILAEVQCSVEFVDLRHSVKTDAGMTIQDRERQIFNTCFDEITNCEPFFVGLLGHRYGWVPGRELITGKTVELPKSFPIAEENLSVTAFEFVHSMFEHSLRHHYKIFLRDSASYDNLSATERNNYVDTDEFCKTNINLLRDYVTSMNDNNTIHYTLDVTKGIVEENIECIKLFEKEILSMICAEHHVSSDVDCVTSNYTIEHERIVQYHLRKFKGRERELEECQRKLETRKRCLLAAYENGVGRTAFMCKLYDLYRSDSHNVCLIYLENTPSAFKFEDSIRYWNIELNQRLNAGMYEAITSAGNDNKLQFEIFESLTQIVKDNGQNLYMFVDTDNPESFKNGSDYVLASIIIEDENDHALRPLMYILPPLSNNTKYHILHGLRSQVADIIMNNASSANTKWISKAFDIMQTMMKYDFLRIRMVQDDNEAAITRYQCEMAKSLPESYDELMAFWFERICNMAGIQTVHDYIFLMAMSPEGWNDKTICSILSCSNVEIAMIRQMLGQDVITMGSFGNYVLNDSQNIKSWLGSQTLQENQEIIKQAYQVVTHEHTHVSNGLHFLLSLLAGKYEDCMQKICSGYDSSLDESLVWLSNNYPHDFNRLAKELLCKHHLVNESFTKYSVEITKRIGLRLNSGTYVKWLEVFIQNLRQLHIEGKITTDHNIYSCELLACRFDCCCSCSDWQRAYNAVLDGLAATQQLAAHSAKYQKYYVYFLFRIVGFIHNSEGKAKCIEDRFLKIVDSTNLALNSSIDTTLHSVMYVRASELYASRGKKERATLYCKKALNLGLKMVCQKRDGISDTYLDFLSVKRNLLNILDLVQILHADYGVINNEDMSQLYVDIMTLCGDIPNEAGSDDRIYYLYYVVQVRQMLSEGSDAKTKVERLYEIEQELLHRDGLDSIFYCMHQRQTTYMDWRFKAWLFIKTIMLSVYSQLDEFRMPIPECCNIYLKDKIKCKDYDIISFDNEVGMLLPIIGAKLSAEIDMTDPLSSIAEQLFNLYVAMIRRDSKRDKGVNAQRMISLFHNAFEIYSEISISDFTERVQYKADLASLGWIHKDICEKFGDRIDENLPFNDFSDFLGLSGDIYASKDGMWAGDDPELEISMTMASDGYNRIYSQTALEELTDSEEYDEIINKLCNEEELGFMEIYYLALAYLRTDQYIKAINIISIFLTTEEFPDIISEGDIFSSEVLYLTACLLGHEFENFDSFIASCDEEFLADDDVLVLTNAYTSYKKNANNENDIHLPKPYGYKL